jgi:hypothetical protein
MELRRRFVFRGNASAFGGRIIRPDDVTLEMPGASSLGVVGGRSIAKIAATNFKNFVSFGSASTLAEGRFDDANGLIDLTHHRVREDALRTSTRVRAEVNKLVVGRAKRLKISRMVAELTGASPSGSGEPPMPVGGVAIEGVTIDGFALRVVLDASAFTKYSTHAELVAAAAKPDFSKRYGDQFFMSDEMAGFPSPGRGRLVPHRERIYATIVKKLEWEQNPNPQATIERHSVVIKDFGRIFFGEILISASARRLTMFRAELGSEEGGQAGGPDVDVNGGWSP